MIPRKTRADLAVSGGHIPAEAEVICFLGSANRDERKFTAPDQYDMRRTDLDADRAFTSVANHAAFGAGRHFCLGAMMAKTEVEIAMNRLLDATDRLSFADGEPPGDQGLFLRGPSRLALRFHPTRSPRTPVH
jgi:cytochrome P450